MTTRMLLTTTVLLAGLSAAGAGERPLSIGMSVGSLSHPYFTASIAGARDEAKKIDPQAILTTVGSDWDLGKQDNQMSNFITAGDRVILVNAADPKAIGAQVEKARAAGIVVAAFDVSAAGADVTVMTDNVKAGEIACGELARQIGGKGNVVIINGPPVSSVLDRVSGCKAALKASPDIKVISDNQNPGAGRDGGLAAMQGLLTRFPRIDGVFAINDEQAIGADLAAKQMNRAEMKIAAVDGSPAGIDAIRSGSSRIVATAAQNPYTMAAKAVDLAVEVMRGKKLDGKVVLLAPSLVTSANAATTEGWPTHL